MSLHLFVDLYLAVAGLIVGSYLNVVIHRIPRLESTVLPRSRCPTCNALIRPWDNIPLLSYLLLRGRCRQCRASISWRYPLIEAATATCFVLAFETFGPSWLTLVAIVYSCLLIALAGIDAEHYILPDRLTWPGMGLGFLVAVLTPWMSWQSSLIGIAVGGGILWAVSEFWYRVRKVDGLGLGDVKMLAMIGAFIGWRGVVATLFISSLAGSLVGISMMLLGRMDFKSRLPFGVFLALGGIVTLFAGPYLLSLYGLF